MLIPKDEVNILIPSSVMIILSSNDIKTICYATCKPKCLDRVFQFFANHF